MPAPAQGPPWHGSAEPEPPRGPPGRCRSLSALCACLLPARTYTVHTDAHSTRAHRRARSLWKLPGTNGENATPPSCPGAPTGWHTTNHRAWIPQQPWFTQQSRWNLSRCPAAPGHGGSPQPLDSVPPGPAQNARSQTRWVSSRGSELHRITQKLRRDSHLWGLRAGSPTRVTVRPQLGV